MTDIVLNNITSGYNIAKVNDNFQKIEDSINNDLLNRSGSNNTMAQDLDMNSNNLLNVENIDVESIKLNGLTLAPETVVVTDAVLASDLASTAAGKGASLVGFEQVGPGAVARPLLDKSRETLSPEDYGAVGDGVTDDTTSLNKWSAALTLTGRPGRCRSTTYRVTQYNNGVTFSGLRGTVIDFNGCTFKTLDADPVVGNQAGLYFTDCQDCTFSNFIYDANRSTRTPVEVASHSINIGPSTSRIKFIKCQSINSVVDGWYARGTPGVSSSYPTDITMEDCTGMNSFRNNVSLINSIRFKIIRGRYNGANGTAPEFGIDLEPNTIDIGGNSYFEIIDVETSGNGSSTSGIVGYGLSVTSSGPGWISGLTGSGNSQKLLNIETSKDICVNKVRCYDQTSAVTGLISIGSAATGITLNDLDFQNITAPATTGGECCLRLQGPSVFVRGMRVRNSTITGIFSLGLGQDVDGISIEDCTATSSAIDVLSSGVNSRFSRISVRRCGGYGLQFQAANCVAENVYVEDSASVTSSIRFASGATGGIGRGLRVLCTSGTPAGNAIRVDCILDELTNVSCSGGFTSTTSIYGSTTSFVGTVISGIHPDAFANTSTINPSSISAGGTYKVAISLPRANPGDACLVHVPYDLQGIVATAYCYTIGAVTLVLFNPTASAISLGSGSWKISLKKS